LDLSRFAIQAFAFQQSARDFDLLLAITGAFILADSDTI
jgi:hypothetical protein